MQSITLAPWVVFVLLLSTAGYAQTPARQEPPLSQPDSPRQDRTLGKAISDSWITMKVHALFIPEDALDNSNIDVDTRAGVVTLSGTVASDAGRKRAMDLARSADGVKSVNDAALRVAPETVGTAGTAATAGKRAGRSINDGWIKSKVYSQFLTEETLNDSDIDVDVSNGVVNLTGTARPLGVARAEAIAKATDGVKSVKNAIRMVTP